MNVSREEKSAVNMAVEIGGRFGYGNIVAHLLSAWANELSANGMDEEGAMAHVSGRLPYPIQMHLDILDNGEWDETGKKYRKKKKKEKA